MAVWARFLLGTGIVAGIFSQSFAFEKEGRQLYEARCAPCHGKQGQGKPKSRVPSLTSDEVRQKSDEGLKDLILRRANGEMERNSAHARMKQRLTAEQVNALISYLRILQSRSR